MVLWGKIWSHFRSELQIKEETHMKIQLNLVTTKFSNFKKFKKIYLGIDISDSERKRMQINQMHAHSRALNTKATEKYRNDARMFLAADTNAEIQVS